MSSGSSIKNIVSLFLLVLNTNQVKKISTTSFSPEERTLNSNSFLDGHFSKNIVP
jgi:hypothetical protein